MTKHDQKHELIKAILLATSAGISVFSMGSAFAGGPITQLTTSTTPATALTYTGSDSNTYNWGQVNGVQGTDLHLDGFQFGGNSYVPVFLADDVDYSESRRYHYPCQHQYQSYRPPLRNVC